MSPADIVRVQVAAAQTAIIVGWLAFNVSRPGEALAHWILAHELASEASHNDLTAYALACRSRLHSRVHRGDQAVAPATALVLLNRALVMAATSTDVALRSWLLVNRAEQHAASGDALACGRDLDGAALVIEGPGTQDDVLWAHWSPARIDTYRGNCARLLHRPAEAISVLESLLGRLDPRVIPARTLPLADLAVAYAEQGEIERACELLTESLMAANEAGYPEGARRVVDVRSTALAGRGGVSAVRHLDELLGSQR
jgi:tetratricopeptide (TPR) repeat protein